jgi:DNA-directed RNA polymerase subunit N (RpoN/RPB10)
MLYPKCPTCRTVLANKQLPFEKAMEKICASDKYAAEKSKMKEELLNELQLKRYCCRQRILGFVDLTDIIT